MRTGLSCPRAWGAVGGCWIMLARLLGCQCATAGGSWRWCVCGPPVSAGPGSGIRPPSRGRPSSSSVCLHCVVCTCLCQCTGGGDGGQGPVRAAAAAFLAGLYRSSVGLISGSAAAEAPVGGTVPAIARAWYGRFASRWGSRVCHCPLQSAHIKAVDELPLAMGAAGCD